MIGMAKAFSVYLLPEFDVLMPYLIMLAVLMFGAEQSGMSEALLRRAGRVLRIPGSGSVESLNIASAAAVMASEFRRRHRLVSTTQ